MQYKREELWNVLRIRNLFYIRQSFQQPDASISYTVRIVDEGCLFRVARNSESCKTDGDRDHLADVFPV